MTSFLATNKKKKVVHQRRDSLLPKDLNTHGQSQLVNTMLNRL
jgi:hypothetical protein